MRHGMKRRNNWKGLAGRDTGHLSDSRSTVCQRLCAYHKPGIFEEPGCGALVRLTEMAVDSALLEEALADNEGGFVLWGIPQDDPRLLSVCAGCDFLAEGCDFRNPAVPRESCSPCGGLRALALLIREKILP